MYSPAEHVEDIFTETPRQQRCESSQSDPFTCTVQWNTSKTGAEHVEEMSIEMYGLQKCVIRDNMVIGGKSFAWYSESANVRKAEFDTKTSEASHGFLERMPNLDTKDALAILGRELVENNTLKKCFVGRWVETVCVCANTPWVRVLPWLSRPKSCSFLLARLLFGRDAAVQDAEKRPTHRGRRLQVMRPSCPIFVVRWFLDRAAILVQERQYKRGT